MTTTTTAATTPAPAYGPATDIAVAENASPAAAGPHAPYAAHPNPTKKETPMTNQAIPADKVREWVTSWETTRPEHRTLEDAEGIIQALRDLLPTPPRPTLADMTSEERDGCERMQCDVGGEDARAVIFNPYWEDGSARVMWPDGVFTYPGWERVTPRPDLPRLEWPGPDQDGEEATKVDYVSVAGGRTAYGPWTVARLRKKADTTPALPDGWRLADHEKYGRVIVTSPAPDAYGDVCFVAPAPGTIGNDWHLCDPADLTYLDQEARIGKENG